MSVLGYSKSVNRRSVSEMFAELGRFGANDNHPYKWTQFSFGAERHRRNNYVIRALTEPRKLCVTRH